MQKLKLLYKHILPNKGDRCSNFSKFIKPVIKMEETSGMLVMMAPY